MEVVLVGLPGAGKSAVGAKLATRLGARFIETDREVERIAGRPIEAIFESGGEPAFRAAEREVIAALGEPDRGDRVSRVIATGGGAVIDPRNRWDLYRGRHVAWLHAPASVLAARLRRSPSARPLLSDQDLETGLDELLTQRARFYAAGMAVDASGSVEATVASIERLMARPPSDGGVLLRADLATGRVVPGRVVLGDRMAASSIDAELRRLDARRAVLVSEPTAWSAVGTALGGELSDRGWTIQLVLLPEGEAAKRLSVIETAASELAQRSVERTEPIVAIGGGALTDAAGFLAAAYQRGIPWLAVPTTLLGQLDAAHGGKTGVDLPEGKNLLGAFHLPAAVIVDTALLDALPVRHRRAALAEAVKDGILGDPRLLEVLERDGVAIAAGIRTSEPSALAEVVERAAWVKLRTVEADPTEQRDRISLNLGHTLGHAIEAAGGFGPVLHGEAVAYGLRAAARIGQGLGATPAAVAQRIEGLLDRLELAVAPLPYPVDAVIGTLGTDKKRRHGALRWVIPTGDGWLVAEDVAEGLVREVATSVLAGREAGGTTAARRAPITATAR